MTTTYKPTGNTKVDLWHALAYWQGVRAYLDGAAWGSCPHPETKTCNLNSHVGRWRYGYNFARDSIEGVGSSGRRGGDEARQQIDQLCKNRMRDLEKALQRERSTMTNNRPKSELTLREFAEAVGRSMSTIRRHLQADAGRGKPGPLHGKPGVTLRHDRWFFAAYLVDWYKDNIMRRGWDQPKEG